MPLLLKPSVPYVPNRSDIWDAHVPPLVTVPGPGGEIPEVPLLEETLIVQVAPMYNNRIGYVSQQYSDLSGIATVGSKTSPDDQLCWQAIAHGTLANPAQKNRFDCFFAIPVKSFKANGLLIGENYLELLLPGYFYFNVHNVGGYEALYNLQAGDALELTEIETYGGI